MRFALIAVAAAFLGCVSAPSGLRAEPGTLVIVGGGLDPENGDVLTAFLEARPSDRLSIAIVPAASGEPSQSAQSFREALIRHGADPAHVEVVHLALKDDPGTPDIDESEWAGNAGDAEEIGRIKRAGAIWFTGGDQSRITRLLLGDEGRETPMLTAIRQRLADGAVIGGTSAGAAIMSDPMIVQGDTLAALLPGDVGEPLALGRGLGFAQGMLVDQHFGQRARLGRLAAALVKPEQPWRTGVGIDEDTALVIRIGADRARVLGTGYVTFIDARKARVGVGERFAAENFAISLAASGDTLDLASGKVTPGAFKAATISNEYFDSPTISGGGMALGSTNLADVAGEALLDNSAARIVERHSFAGGAGVTFRFTQTADSRGWWGRGPNGEGRYALDALRFDIEPIDLTITKADH